MNLAQHESLSASVKMVLTTLDFLETVRSCHTYSGMCVQTFYIHELDLRFEPYRIGEAKHAKKGLERY